MAHITDSELEELREALDTVWALLPSEEVVTLQREQPEIVETCRNNHQWVSHR